MIDGANFSLERPQSGHPLLSLQAQPHTIDFDPSSTALLVIDMQNDFCHPEGWFASRGLDAAPLMPAIPAIQWLTDAVRRFDVPVIWLNWGLRADCANIPFASLEKAQRTGLPGYGDPSPSGRGRVLVRDEWGAAIIDELNVDPRDLIVHKHRLSGFCDNELDSILRRRRITTLMFAGINTDRCVFSTLQDANFLGYRCVLVDDACASISPNFVCEAVLYLIRELHGVVSTTDSIASALGLTDPAALPPRQQQRRSTT